MNRTAAVVSSLALVIAVEWWLYTITVDATLKRAQESQLVEVEKAVKKERQLQENANHELQKQVDAKAVIADNLAADIERLRRERPTRPSVPTTPRATCADANGAELDSINASFLVRYASLAAIQQVELNACRDMYNQARDALKTQE